jgi:hypothetical protein
VFSPVLKKDSIIPDNREATTLGRLGRVSIKAFWRSTWWYERKGSWKSREFTGGTLQLNRLARWKATAHNITIWQFLDTEGESLLHSGLKKKGVFIAIT